MRLRIFFFSFWFLLSTATSAQEAYKGVYVADMPGCYWNKIQGEESDNPKKIDTAYESLKIKRDPLSGELSFTAKAIAGLAGNYRYCSAVGKLEVNELAGDLMVLAFKPNEEQLKDTDFVEHPCRLQIIVTPRRMVFFEPDRACSEYFACGEGAAMHRMSFSRRHRKSPKGTDICTP